MALLCGPAGQYRQLVVYHTGSSTTGQPGRRWPCLSLLAAPQLSEPDDMSLSPGGGGGGYAFGVGASLCASAACAARRRRRGAQRARAAATAANLSANKQTLHQLLRAKQILAWGLAVLPTAAAAGCRQPPRSSAAALSGDIVEMVARALAAIPLPSPQWLPASGPPEQGRPMLVNEAWQIERKQVRQQQQQQQQRAYTEAEEQLLERFAVE